MVEISPIFEWKKVGETPSQVIDRHRKKHGIADATKMCFLGRLDPMAQGILPLLIGDDCKKMTSFLYNDKTYTVEAILGVRTDTYDPLGIIKSNRVITDVDISTYIVSMIGLKGSTFEQEYPPYSSFVVKGNPLWWWAMNGKWHELPTVPSKKVTVKDVIVGSVERVKLDDYIAEVSVEINSVTVTGFRQTEALASWSDLRSRGTLSEVIKIKLTFTVSGGTYIRSLVNCTCPDIPAHAHLITRTEYSGLPGF